ncbi:MAG: peptidogalycan biosysnthesis protein [Tannerella sp.]|jgi:predicted N-acyltransferase|nr:peptidogalycan biosysnthesis protein [Tannerella sp.]
MCRNDISYEWYDSVSEIDKSDWVEIYGCSLLKSYEFFQAMEASVFPNVTYHYLKIYDPGDVLSILPCFSYHLDIVDILVNVSVKKMIKTVRKVFPRFFMLRTFVSGSYASSCEHFIEIKEDTDMEKTVAVRSIISEQLKKMQKTQKASVTMIKEVRDSQLQKVSDTLSEDFFFFSAFPTNFIPVGGLCSPYPVALKKKHRKRFRKYKEKFEQSFTWSLIPDFDEYTKVLTELYLNTLEKSKNKFEILNESFFSNINKYMAEESFLLVVKDLEGKIRLMEIVLEEKEKLIPLYLGIKYMDDDARVLYLNTIFRTIEEAEKRNKTVVEFGQTSYYPKVMSGSFVEDIHYGFYSCKPVVQFMIKHLFRSIFSPMSVPDNVYLDSVKGGIIAKYKKMGYSIMNVKN